MVFSSTGINSTFFCLARLRFLLGLALIRFWLRLEPLEEDFGLCGCEGALCGCEGALCGCEGALCGCEGALCGCGGNTGPKVCKKNGCGVVDVVVGNKVPAVGKNAPRPEPSAPRSYSD